MIPDLLQEGQRVTADQLDLPGLLPPRLQARHAPPRTDPLLARPPVRRAPLWQRLRAELADRVRQFPRRRPALARAALGRVDHRRLALEEIAFELLEVREQSFF